MASGYPPKAPMFDPGDNPRYRGFKSRSGGRSSTVRVVMRDGQMLDTPEVLPEPAQPTLERYARRMRAGPTASESAMLRLLSAHFPQYDFRCQWVMLDYILDFYSPTTKVAIEVDGRGHDDPVKAAADRVRSRRLSGCGIKVIRFKNEELSNPEEVISQLRNEI